MGTDKALIEIDGIPMAERVARVLEAAGCDPVVFIGGDPALADSGRRHVPDRWPGEGPIGGVITALAAVFRSDVVVVAACDLPDLTVDAVRAVIGDEPDPDTIRVGDSGRIEPMLACWPTSLGRDTDPASGPITGPLHAWIAAHNAVRVPVDPAAVRNVNRPGDL